MSTEDGAELGLKWGSPFFETSAKLDININHVFSLLARKIIKQQSPYLKGIRPKSTKKCVFI